MNDFVNKSDCIPAARASFKAALNELNGAFSTLHYLVNERPDDEQFAKYVQDHGDYLEIQIKQALLNFRAGVVLEIAGREGVA